MRKTPIGQLNPRPVHLNRGHVRIPWRARKYFRKWLVACALACKTLPSWKPWITASRYTDSAGFDLPGTAAVYDYFACLPLHVRGDTTDFPDSISLVHREPIGVCAAIVPWNYSDVLHVAQACTGLGGWQYRRTQAGQSLRGLSILEFFEECKDIIPPGVVNIVTGYGPAVGEPLVRNPAVRKVSFTGSRPTARKIMQYASQNIIPQTMELGGKSANIICADADLDAAAEGVVMSTIFNKGEVCIAGTRTFVHESIKDKFLDKLTTLDCRRPPGGSPRSSDTAWASGVSDPV